MTKADPMAASGQTSFDVQTEAHSLPSQNRGMVVQVAPVPLNAAKIELQESGITEKIQPSNGKTADSNSIMEEIKKTAKVKKRHLRPKHVKAPRKRGAQPENRNALKHGKYTRELRALRADIRAHIRRSREILNEIPVHLAHRGGPGRPREHW